MSCCNYTTSLPIKEQQYYYQSGYWYYPQQYIQYNQPMAYPTSDNNAITTTTTTTTTFTEFELPMSNNNVLQDDNFSIVTASDLYQASPSSIPPHLSPYSTPSPQLSDIYYTTHSDYYSMMDLFGPVEQSTSKKITAAAEKKHICPVCSHRSKRRHNLVEHMLTHNPHRPKIFKCSHCCRPFARKYDMKRHEKIHTR